MPLAWASELTGLPRAQRILLVSWPAGCQAPHVASGTRGTCAEWKERCQAPSDSRGVLGTPSLTGERTGSLVSLFSKHQESLGYCLLQL